MVSPTSYFTHSSCATNVNHIPESGDNEVYHIPVSRAGKRPSGLMCILLFEHGVVTIRSNSVHRANRSSPLELKLLILYLPKAEGPLSCSNHILVLKSHIGSSLSVLGMF